jgi:hypothetical protein
VKRSLRIGVVTAAAAIAAAAAAAAFVLGAGDEDGASAARAADPTRCLGLAPGAARSCYTREFTAMVDGRDNPQPAVAAIAAMAWKQGGFLLANCHGVMHTVGRSYAHQAGLTVARLMNYLPRSNDPGCSAGFAHGLVTGVAPDIDPRRPRAAQAVCANAGTRYRQYSCTHGFGHAFMRMNGDRLAPALELCRELGPRAAPDCAQGAFHDYWFAVVGADDAKLPERAVTEPRTLCAAQPAPFVRACWYRAYIDNRPAGLAVRSSTDIEAACSELRALQRQACITAASVIGPPDPAVQLRICAGLTRGADAESCIRGTKVQNLLGYPVASFVELIGGCERFRGRARPACYRWLGKALAVVTDGVFGAAGCPRLAAPDARRFCAVGARRMNEALVTFS